MNNLKQVVGLLNAQAPEGEFLAYINEDEAQMLKDAGGSGLLTEQGIPSYRGVGGYRGGSGGSGGVGGREAPASGGGNRSGGGGADKDNNREQYSVQRTLTPKTKPVDKQKVREGSQQAPYEMVGGQKYAVGDPRIPEAKSQVKEKSALEKGADALKDFFLGGGVVGSVFRAIGNFAEDFNKKRRNDYMSTYDIKQYELGTGKNWNPNNVTDVNSDEYKYLKNETDYFNNANIESNRDENDPVTFFDNPQDASITNLTTNTNPFSQVNNYFSTTGSSNLGISGDFMKAYDQAKADLSKSLNMTTNANQFGYNANMSASNIYYNYLKEQGLL